MVIVFVYFVLQMDIWNCESLANDRKFFIKISHFQSFLSFKLIVTSLLKR